MGATLAGEMYRNAAPLNELSPRTLVLVAASDMAERLEWEILPALKAGKVGHLGLDVYEGEAGVFFSDLSFLGVEDDILARLLTFPNVLITSHQGFFTAEALTAIAETTIANVTAFEATGRAVHEVSVEKLA